MESKGEPAMAELTLEASVAWRLEALAVNNARAALVVLVLGDPHLLEGGERGQDGASDPDEVLALGRGDDLDLHGRGGKCSQFLVQALVDVREHCGAAGEDSVSVQVTADVHVAFLNRIIGELVDTRGFLADQAGLEERLAGAEALGAHGDDLAVGELV